MSERMNWKTRDKLRRATNHLIQAFTHLNYGNLPELFLKERKKLAEVYSSLTDALYTPEEQKERLKEAMALLHTLSDEEVAEIIKTVLELMAKEK